MGKDFQFGGCLYFEDGTKFVEVENIPELVISSEDEQDHEPILTAHDEISFKLLIRSFEMRRLRRTWIGWRAPGPLRLRQLARAGELNQRRRKA